MISRRETSLRFSKAIFSETRFEKFMVTIPGRVQFLFQSHKKLLPLKARLNPLFSWSRSFSRSDSFTSGSIKWATGYEKLLLLRLYLQLPVNSSITRVADENGQNESKKRVVKQKLFISFTNCRRAASLERSTKSGELSESLQVKRARR